MDPSKWIDIVVTVSAGTCFILFLKLYTKSRSLLEIYFALAAFILGMPYLLDLFTSESQAVAFEWFKLTAIITYISGLLVLIRESKPVFARFPVYLTALPFISFLFFPFIIDSIVIKDLLNALYQGGALVVTILVFTVNNMKQSGRRYYLLGIIFAIVAYLSYWAYLHQVNADYIWISEILFSIGVVVTAVKFVRQKSDLLVNG